MPRDLFAEQGINPSGAQSAPRDLFAEKGISPMNALERYGLRDPAAGLGYGMQDVANLGMMGAKGMLNMSPFLKQAAQQLAPNQTQQFQNMQPLQTNFSQAAGIPNPNFGDKLIQGAAEYAPFGIGGAEAKGMGMVSSGLEQALSKIPYAGKFSPEMAAQAAPGAAFGAASQPNTPVSGALEGAGLNMAAAPIAGGLGTAMSGAKDYLTKFGASGLAKNIADALNSAKDTSKTQAFQMAKNNLEMNAKPEVQASWNELKRKAKISDSTPYYEGYYPNQESPQQNVNMSASNSGLTGIESQQPQIGMDHGTAIGMPQASDISTDVKRSGDTLESNKLPAFNDDKYNQLLTRKLNKLAGESERQSPLARKNSEGIDLIGGYLNDQHGTLTDAIEHAQALNEDYRNQITPGKSLPFDVVNYAKSALKKTIKDNLNDRSPELLDLWNNSNNLTKNLHDTFFKVSTPAGKSNPSTFATLLNNKSQFTDTSKFVDDYIPKSRTEGTQKMQQFSNMVGNEDAAKNVLKMSTFENAYDDKSQNGVDVKKFLNKFNGLSDDQQKYLFNDDHLNQISALNKIMQKNPDVLNKPTKEFSLLSHGLPALLGFTAGMHFGGPIGGALGAAGTAATQYGLTKMMSTPSMQESLIQRLINPQAQTMGPVGKAVQGTLPYTLTPAMMRGNQ